MTKVPADASYNLNNTVGYEESSFALRKMKYRFGSDSTTLVLFNWLILAAWEGVLGANISEPIVWNFAFGFDVSNPVVGRVLMSGTRRGFPAYEVYVKKSNGDNMPLYQRIPATDRAVLSLFNIEQVTAGTPLEISVP